jgi:8-oxo-dGTP diphosphatase
MCTNNTIKILYICEMNKNESLSNNISNFDNYLPGQSIDCVIIGFKNHELHVLVLKWKNVDAWSLPGGFINLDENMDESAIHILKGRTGLSFPYLDQFYTFGSINRGGIKPGYEDISKLGLDIDINAMVKWLDQRFITTGYFALVDINKCNPKPDYLSEKCEWKPIKNLPNLTLDHQQILRKALDHIKISANYLPIGITLLPELFTMKELQKLYESIVEKELDRGNFQRKMLKLGLFIRQEKLLTGAANKAAYLYKFDKVKYEEMLVKGIGFIS